MQAGVRGLFARRVLPRCGHPRGAWVASSHPRGCLTRKTCGQGLARRAQRGLGDPRSARPRCPVPGRGRGLTCLLLGALLFQAACGRAAVTGGWLRPRGDTSSVAGARYSPGRGWGGMQQLVPATGTGSEPDYRAERGEMRTRRALRGAAAGSGDAPSTWSPRAAGREQRGDAGSGSTRRGTASARGLPRCPGQPGVP